MQDNSTPAAGGIASIASTQPLNYQLTKSNSTNTLLARPGGLGAAAQTTQIMMQSPNMQQSLNADHIVDSQPSLIEMIRSPNANESQHRDYQQLTDMKTSSAR